ncbi:hypothetical protein [Streptomyces sp. NPDC088847]|uniref:hypothetical protein n=1 Tax=Streptomyces sp. NPDC088847 TaxID=3365909 RepID=UPI0037FE8C24
MAQTTPPVRPLDDLRTSGLLWLMNRAALHPRGLALALHYGDNGEPEGWTLLVSPDGGPWSFPEHTDHALYRRAETTIATARAGQQCTATLMEPFHGLARCETHPAEGADYQHEGTAQDGSRMLWSDGGPGATPDRTSDPGPTVRPDTDDRPRADGGIVRPGPLAHVGQDGTTCTLPPTSADTVRPGEDVRPRPEADEGRTDDRRAEVRQAIDAAFLSPDEDGAPIRILPAGDLTLGPDGLTDVERQRKTIRDTLNAELSHDSPDAVWEITCAVSRALLAMPRYATPSAEPSGIRGLLEHVGVDTSGRCIFVAGECVDHGRGGLLCGPARCSCGQTGPFLGTDPTGGHWHAAPAGEGNR